MAKYVLTHIDKNNLLGSGSSATGTAATIEQLTATYQHFDFSLRWTGADGAVASATPWVGLVESGALGGYGSFFVGPDPSSPISVQWSAGTLAGTVKENYYNFTTLIASATRDNVDPGFGVVDTSGATAPIGRPGPRYRFELFDVYYRIFTIGDPKPRAIIPAPSAGFPLPLRLMMGAQTNVMVQNVEAGGSLLPSAIYTKEAQTADGVTTPVYERIYQQSRYAGVQGIPTDIVVP